jgi:hypothetical protein
VVSQTLLREPPSCSLWKKRRSTWKRLSKNCGRGETTVISAALSMKSGDENALNPSGNASLEKLKNNIRRSTRLARRIPVIITSLDPAHIFSGNYETAVINAHGCGIVLPQRLGKGTPVTVELVASGLSKKARIVLAITIIEGSSWLLGLEFDLPTGSFWQVEDPPQDWLE